MQLSAFPLVAFDRVDHPVADRALVAWGHYLGACGRPFGRQSFGLSIEQELLAVCVSASTVGKTSAGYPRGEVVELARLCAAPGHGDLTRVALRLWRKVAPDAWAAKYWPVRALVAYASHRVGHSGQIYRFDGWTRFGDVGGGSAGKGSGWAKRKRIDRKTLWVFPLPVMPAQP